MRNFVVRLIVLSLALIHTTNALCDFSDQAVCDACEGTEVDCNTAIRDHCNLKDWNEAACKDAKVGCPFAWVMRDGELPSSPCTMTACNGAIPDAATCLTAVQAYCTYEFVQANTAGVFHTVDASCAPFVAPGCSSGSIPDCNGDCVPLTKLNDGTCEDNLNCALLNRDGNDCIPDTPSPSPSAAPSTPRCCSEINMECCSCEQEQSRFGFCRRCRAGTSEASQECCDQCAAPRETTLSVVLMFPAQPLTAFTPTVRVGLRKGFAKLCSQEGEFSVNYTDVSLTLTETEAKQAAVTGEFTTVLPDETAASDALTVLQDEDAVLASVNEAVAAEGATLVFAEVGFLNSTSVTEPESSSGKKKDDDTALIVVLVLLFVVVLPLSVLGGWFLYKKHQAKESTPRDQFEKQNSARAMMVQSPEILSKKATAATDADFMM